MSNSLTADYIVNEMPEGYRWANESEYELFCNARTDAERAAVDSRMVQVRRTHDSNGVAYGPDVTDLAIRIS